MREGMVSKHKNTNTTGVVKPSAANPVNEGDAGDRLALGGMLLRLVVREGSGRGDIWSKGGPKVKVQRKSILGRQTELKDWVWSGPGCREGQSG